MSSTEQQPTKDSALDVNKALQIMLNGVTAVQAKGKYTFEESFFTTQALYGLQALSAAQQQASTTGDAQVSEESATSSTKPEVGANDKVMRVTWPEQFTVDDYIEVIIRHLDIGQQRGAFNFSESALVGRAIAVFRTPQPQQKQEQEQGTAQPQTVVL